MSSLVKNEESKVNIKNEHQMTFSLIRGWLKACFFSNSNTCINSILDTQHNGLWQIHAPLLQIKEKRRFESISFTAISRSVNGQAHNLAKESLHSVGLHIISYDFNVLSYRNHE